MFPSLLTKVFIHIKKVSKNVLELFISFIKKNHKLYFCLLMDIHKIHKIVKYYMIHFIMPIINISNLFLNQRIPVYTFLEDRCTALTYFIGTAGNKIAVSII